MKSLLILLFLVSITAIQAQTSDFVGIYILKEDAENGVAQHKMALHEEGTFLFSTFFSPEDTDGKMLEIKSMYGSGKWRVNGNQVFFVVDKEEDFDEDRILDFSKTRARIQQPAPGNTNGETGPDQLVFFDSDIFWIKGLKLNKM
ncbi:MAG: hypothetical protein KJP14_11000 [Eudoraea sp.]|nr:hypothetical protein [Eudoraea sp.]